MLFSGIQQFDQSSRQRKHIFDVFEPSSMVEYLKNQMFNILGIV